MSFARDDQDESRAEVHNVNRPGFGYFNRVGDSVLLERIYSRIRESGYFTDRVTSGRVEVRQSDIVLVISPDKKLVFVSHVRPARTSSTGTRGFKATGPLEFDVAEEELAAVTGSDVHAELAKGFAEPAFRPSLRA